MSVIHLSISTIITSLDTLTLAVDPRFVDASAGDFRLRADSPLIDKGYNRLPSELVKEDRDGNPRVVGGAVDIGAYEFQGRGGGRK